MRRVVCLVCVLGMEVKMNMVLGTNIEAGQKIRTAWGWRKIQSVTSEGAVVKEGLVKFGEPVFGWKAK